jgi:hypothetical protein
MAKDQKSPIRAFRRITERTRAGMRRGGETSKRKRVGIFASNVDPAANGRKGAFASHATNRANKRGLFDSNHPARVVGGRLGGKRCAEKIAECARCHDSDSAKSAPRVWPMFTMNERTAMILGFLVFVVVASSMTSCVINVVNLVRWHGFPAYEICEVAVSGGIYTNWETVLVRDEMDNAVMTAEFDPMPRSSA